MTGKPTRKQSSEPVLEPKPKTVEAPSPFQMIVGFSELALQRGIKSSDAEQVQDSIRQLDRVLKDLAELQNKVGTMRKELGAHARGLRQATPKGKPAEGTVRRLSDGREAFYDSGRWYIIAPNVETKEASKPEES